MFFNVNDAVKIIPFEGVKGRIIGIYSSNVPIEYRVRYFMDCEIKQEYFLFHELERCT